MFDSQLRYCTYGGDTGLVMLGKYAYPIPIVPGHLTFWLLNYVGQAFIKYNAPAEGLVRKTYLTLSLA